MSIGSRIRRIYAETGIVGLLIRPPARAAISLCEGTAQAVRRALGRVPENWWTPPAVRPRLARNGELRDRHRGERCVVLGNGPSLREQDIEVIRGEQLISCNQGYLFLSRRNLAPRYHVVVDPVLTTEAYAGFIDDLAALQAEHGTTIIAGSEVAAALRRRGCGPALYEAHNFLVTDYVERPVRKLPQLTESQFGFLSVIHAAIHFALFMGFDRIILLGCDMDFFIDPAMPFSHSYEAPAYGPGEVPARDLFGWDQIKLMEWCLREFKAFDELKRMADARGASIVNAGIGGALNVFERKTLAMALENSI